MTKKSRLVLEKVQSKLRRMKFMIELDHMEKEPGFDRGNEQNYSEELLWFAQCKRPFAQDAIDANDRQDANALKAIEAQLERKVVLSGGGAHELDWHIYSSILSYVKSFIKNLEGIEKL